jgi:hypothetical protein
VYPLDTNEVAWLLGAAIIIVVSFTDPTGRQATLHTGLPVDQLHCCGSDGA